MFVWKKKHVPPVPYQGNGVEKCRPFVDSKGRELSLLFRQKFQKAYGDQNAYNNQYFHCYNCLHDFTNSAFWESTHHTIMYTAPSGPKFPRKRINALDTPTSISSLECRFLKPFRETIWLPARPKQIINHQIGSTHIVWLHLQNHTYYSRNHWKICDQLRSGRHKRVHQAHSQIRDTGAWHHSSVIQNPWIFWRKFRYFTNNDLLLHLQEFKDGDTAVAIATWREKFRGVAHGSYR